ncbi:hypothetical protein EMIT0P228_30339 [Pseudomonas brassicacearum]
MAHRQQCQFDVTADRKLLEDTVAVSVDGFWRQAQLVGDDLHLLATDNHQRNLDFPLRQCIEGRIVGWLERLDRQLLGDLRADVALPGKNQTNGLDHLVQPSTLGEVTRRARLQQPGGKRILFTHGHRDHLDVRVTAQQLARGLKAADARHLDVHQHHVGLQFARFDQGFFPGFSLANYLQAVDVSQHSCNARTDEIMVIDH